MITLNRQEIVWLRGDVKCKLDEYQRIAENEASPKEVRIIAQVMRENYRELYGKLLDISPDDKRIEIK